MDSQEIFDNVWRNLGLSQLRECYWHLKQLPITKNHLAQNNGTESRGILVYTNKRTEKITIKGGK